ncbi:MAG: oxidoreductase family protein [Dehalococcoidia bacterium]
MLGHSSVVSADIETIGAGRGFAGQVARVRLAYDRDTTTAPATLVAKLPSEREPTRDLAGRFGLYEREVQFYLELAARAGIRAPHIYYATAKSGASVLLLEDVTNGREGDVLNGCTIDEAASVVEALARMHAVWWDSPELVMLDWLPAPNSEAALDLGREIAAPAWRAFLKKAGQHMPARLIALGNRMNGDQSTLHRLSAAPRTLVHGDLTASNVMFAPDGGIAAVLDWQTVVQGRGPIDVAHFFVSSLQPSDRKVAEAELLPRYHQLLLDNGVEDYTYAECWADYRLAVMNQVGQIVAISYLLDISDQLDDEIEAAAGTRPLVALLELDVSDLIPAQSRLRRLLSRWSAPSR